MTSPTPTEPRRYFGPCGTIGKRRAIKYHAKAAMMCAVEMQMSVMRFSRFSSSRPARAVLAAPADDDLVEVREIFEIHSN